MTATAMITRAYVIAAAASLIALAAPAWAQPATSSAPAPTNYLSQQADQENCLSCHGFPGLSRVDSTTGELRLLFCSVDYHTERRGPHARLRCTACHNIDEVTVIPHKVQTPVDCTRSCHIVPSNGVPLNFSHQQVLGSLEHSAHSVDKLKALVFDPPLLRPGQSMCLYCHDQPMFRGVRSICRPTGSGGITERCDKCHLEGMPMEAGYYSSHVAARLRPARPIRQLAQACAVCHSDPKIIAQMKSHDTVASYLHSFHGKANLLGNREPATCLDCHASEQGDIHKMMSRTKPDSSINQAQLPNTCRTPQCHADAPPGMSRAAVHLDLDPRAAPMEFSVAAAFVSLTAGVMIVFFALIALDLLNTALRRRNPDHERLVRLAYQLKETPKAELLLQRMDVHQRFQHWLLAVVFILLVATGMPIKFADTEWASRLTALLGGLTPVRKIHRLCGLILIVGFGYHLCYLALAFIGRVKQSRREGKQESILQHILNSPMMITPKDVRQFGQLFLYMLFIRRERPRFGHFNFMQKFEYWAVFWGIPIMGLSGLVLWKAAGFSEYAPGRLLNFAFIIHSDEAYLAFIYIAVVHIFSVILTPAVFPLSRGTLTGGVPPVELVEGHLGEMEAVAERLGVSVPEEPLPGRGPRQLLLGLVKRGYSLAMVGLCVTLCFISMRFLFGILMVRQAAPTEIVEIPKRMTAEALTASFAVSEADARAKAVPPRGPLAHFHEIPDWFQPDPGNNCTVSGCHGPVPHGKRVEVRAFLNMHATFVDCGVCHAAGADQAKDARWLDLADRRSRPAPAMLRLASAYERWGEIEPKDAASVNDQLLQLLREALKDSGGSAQLNEWLIRLETMYPGSKPWYALVSSIEEKLRFHAHGEYNAKIGLYADGRLLGTPTESQSKAAQEFRSARNAMPETERLRLMTAVHEGVVPKGTLCMPCHSSPPTRIDFGKLGYPAARAQSLQSSMTVQMILSIEQGKQFNLPRVLDAK